MTAVLHIWITAIKPVSVFHLIFKWSDCPFSIIYSFHFSPFFFFIAPQLLIANKIIIVSVPTDWGCLKFTRGQLNTCVKSNGPEPTQRQATSNRGIRNTLFSIWMKNERLLSARAPKKENEWFASKRLSSYCYILVFMLSMAVLTSGAQKALFCP